MLLLAGSSDGQISLIAHAQDRWEIVPFAGHKGGVTCISWGPYGMSKLLGQVLLIDYVGRQRIMRRRKRKR